MSFDLKITNRDLAIGSDGDLDKVQNTDKLVQDVLKLLLTKIGSNPFFPWYGSPLTSSMVGTALDASFLISMAENQIRSGLETIQNLQRDQAIRQKVTPGELLAAIRSIQVLRSPIDPRFFTIELTLLTKALKSITTSFTVTL